MKNYGDAFFNRLFDKYRAATRKTNKAQETCTSWYNVTIQKDEIKPLLQLTAGSGFHKSLVRRRLLRFSEITEAAEHGSLTRQRNCKGCHENYYQRDPGLME